MSALRQPDRLGFSLIELVVVLAVISLLAGVTIPHYLRTRERVKVQQALGVANAMRVALKMYANENVPVIKLPVVYPAASAISNLDDFYLVLSPYLGGEQPKASLGGNGFIAYEVGRDPQLSDPLYSALSGIDRTLFTFTVRAEDRAQTLVTATPSSVRSLFDGDPLQFP